MKDDQTKQEFIQLRAQGISYAKIADQLDVSRTTLIRWASEFEKTIKDQKAIELESLQQKYYVSQCTRIQLLGSQLETLKAELEKRSLTEIPTARLYDLMCKYSNLLKGEETDMYFHGSYGLRFEAP